ncbi:hypothetical protein FBY14_104192 [Azospirillum brasilense]|nr:hypothetical protein FBY14_104192 [Azospirillum brasilense]
MSNEVKRVQPLRGTTGQLAGVAGLPGEIIVDTDRKTVSVHDGEKSGGYPLLREDGDGSAVTVVPAGSAAPRDLSAALGALYDDDGLRVAAPVRVSARLYGTYAAPVYDLKYGTLAAAQYTEQTIAVPEGKQLDIYSIHVRNTGHGKAFGINVQMVAASLDTTNTEPVRAYVGNVINEGPTDVKAMRLNAGGQDGSTGGLMAASLSVNPAATQGTTAIVQGTCTSVHDDKGQAMLFGTVGRWANGIVFDEGDEFMDSVLQASMTGASAEHAKFLKLKNGSGAITYDVDRFGSVFSSVDVHAGADRANSVRITQSSVERTAGPGNLEIKAGPSGGNLYLRSGNNIELTRGAGSAVSAATFSDAGMTVGSGAARVFNDAGILQLRPYTTATLPSAATAGQQIYVSDDAGGPVVAFADGTHWLRVTDRAVVS